MIISTVWAVWRRELQVTLRAPIVYVIGGLFLVVQGIAFAALVGALSDPRRPAPLGALLEGQLAGTLLTWVLQLVVLTLLGMRTIADERRGGGWELLLTARVGEGAAVVGKWLGAVTVYALLWVPTLAYLAVVAMFRTGGGWDLASIAIGYAGAIALGAALLAWTVAASAAATTTLAAGGLGFALLVGLFLVGELPALWPELPADHPTLAAALAAISLRGQLTSLARGELGLSAIVLFAGLAAVGLSLAIALACADRRKRREVRTRFAATGLLAMIACFAGVLAAHHPLRWDASGRTALDAETVTVIGELPGPATLTIIEPTLGALGPLYEEVSRVADRMAEVAPIEVRRIDPAALPGGVAAAAREAGLQSADLASYGGVVVELAGRRRVVDQLQLATIEAGASGEVEISRLAIEQAIAGAFAELATARPFKACTTTGHGELSLTTKADGGGDWTAVGDRLRGEGIAIEDGGDLDRCDVLIVAGPVTPLSDTEALAVQALVRRGGGLVVAAATRPIANGGSGTTGLEGVLASEGLGLPRAIAIDPSLAEVPNGLLVTQGYAAHPINDGFAGARPTLWVEPRVVIATGAAKPLVSATGASWGERDLERDPPVRDPDDLAGPVALAAVGLHRVVAVGSAESFATGLLVSGASAGDLWLARAVRFAAGATPSHPVIAARAPDQVRLVMTAAQRRAVIALSVGGIPLAWILAGGVVVAWRRRRVA